VASGIECAGALARSSICTLFGAEFQSKKSSLLAQNLENKGAEFFLPRRSMVLKVVRGKILETLKLTRLQSCATISFVKDRDYLIDNRYAHILSPVKNESKRKAVGWRDLVPFWESRM
jgi:hypothetical protein